MNKNPECSGDKCVTATGPVKLYPLGGGANQIFCRACWDHENAYRRTRGREIGAPERFPILDWDTAEIYGEAPAGTDVRYTGYVHAKTGLLLGGVKANTAGPFASHDDAHAWTLQAMQANRGAGRDVEGEVQTRWDGKIVTRAPAVVDTSEIPEAGEEFFRKARLVLPNDQGRKE